MKNITILFVLLSILIVNNALHAQSFSLTYNGNTVDENDTLLFEGNNSEWEVVGYVAFHNNSATAKDVLVKKYVIDTLPGTINTFCWSGQCFASNQYIAPTSMTISAGGSTEEFSAHYQPNSLEGITKMMYVFFDENNPNDSVAINIKFHAYPEYNTIEKEKLKSIAFESYPNPVSQNLTVNYKVNNSFSQGYILITDITGSIRERKPIALASDKIMINVEDLANGIYFYSLQVNGIIIATKKLIVQH